ncbi:MAG: T9SS type A sorting domain-containing protein [Prolixibacteraceae bacterium]|nr:T9SS type A sorting domain-containing protein [Prolixibacteraceae bacterium]
MKQILLFLSVILPIVSFGNSHEPEETEMVKEIRTFYDELDHSGMKTNYLFNRGFVILNNLEEWHKGMPVITNNSLWNHMLKCIDASKIKRQAGVEKLMIPEEKISIVDESVIPITVLNYTGDYIQHKSVEEYAKSNVPLIYEPMSIFAGNVLKHKVYSEYVTFSWSPEFYYSNNKGKDVRFDIDFSDSRGFIPVDLNQSQQINVEYDCVGEKSICFRFIEGGDTLISYSYIDIKTLETEAALKSTSVNFNVNGLDYLYDEGADGKLDKPIIISEGFDIMNDQSKSDLKSKWYSRTSILKANGYDIFYVDYDDASQPLQDNAAIIANLIQEINNEKEGNYEGVYIGESMGGIIGRIALKNLENSGYDHQIGLYVPYDSPFKGAYIPEGIQWAIHDLYTYSGNLMIGSLVASIFFDLFSSESLPSATFLMSQLNSSAARQMLSRHYLGNNIHLSFRTYLDNLGYPGLCRNVAIVNGSDDADYLGYPTIPGYEIFSHTISLGVGIYQATTWYSMKNRTQRVSRVRIYEVLPFGRWIPFDRDETLDNKLHTNAPGSYFDVSYNQYGYSGHVKFTFVPTLSAIDISNSIYNSGFFGYFDNNEDAIIANGLTPFDDIYINGDNTYHVSGIYDLNLFSNYVVEQEIMYEDMYLQNRSLNYDRDFEASNTITVGSNTQPWGNDKHQDTGDFIINSGATVNMEAGTSIKLESGFKLCNGANFKASVDGSNPMLKSASVEKLSAPSIIGNKYISDSETYSTTDDEYDNISWTLLGNNTNYNVDVSEISLPVELKNGQYTLICTGEKNGQEAASSKIIVVRKSNTIEEDNSSNLTETIITVYPNPANNILIINFGELNIQSMEIVLTNTSGNTVLRKSNLNCNTYELDISSLPEGVYVVNVFNNNANIFTERIVKL